MITPEVVAFVKAQDAKGIARETTRAMLISQGGWSTENIDAAFAAVPLVFAAPTAQTPNPPPQPEISAAPEPEPELKKRSPAFTLAIVGVALGAVLASAGVAYALVPGVKYEVNFMLASPEEKVLLSLQKLMAEPERYEVTIATEIYNEGKGVSNSLLNVRSASEVVSTVERIEGDATGLPLRMRSTFSYVTTGSGKSETVRGEAYADSEKLLVRLLDSADFLFFNADALLGKWISLLEGSAEDMEALADGGLMEGAVIGYSTYRETVAYLLSRAPEYLLVEDTGDTRSITGVKARRFMVSFDTDALASILAQAPFATSDRIPLEVRQTLKDEAIPQMLEELSAQAPIELWIREKTHYPIKWRMKQRVPEEALGISYERVVETTGTLRIDDALVPVEAPEKDLTFEEAFSLAIKGTGSLFRR